MTLVEPMSVMALGCGECRCADGTFELACDGIWLANWSMGALESVL